MSLGIFYSNVVWFFCRLYIIYLFLLVIFYLYVVMFNEVEFEVRERGENGGIFLVGFIICVMDYEVLKGFLEILK